MADKITLEEIELTKALADERTRLLEIAERRLQVHIQEAKLSGEIVKDSEILQLRAKARALVAVQLSAELDKQQQKMLDQIAEHEKQLEELKKQEGVKQDLIDAEQEHLDKLHEQYDLITDPERLKAMKDELDTVETTNTAYSNRVGLAQQTTNQMGALVGVTDNWEQGIAGSTFRLLQAEDGVERLALGMMETFSLQNIGASMIDKVVEASLNLLKAQDRAISSFKKATGAGDEYNSVIVDTHMELRTFGVSTEQAGAATQALFKNMSQFSEVSKSAQKDLAGTTAILTNFGISADNAAGSMEVFQKALGMSATGAADASRDLFALGQAINVPPEVIFNEFGPAAGKLAAHGNDMIRVFQGMAAASKATGASISSLLQIAGQFDEFETGAQAVGKLNALLGGPYLNSIEMLNATEEERIRLMIQSLEVSGKNFGALGKYEQRAIAAAAGITDMAEANKIFGSSLSAYDAMQRKAKAASMSQEEFQEASKKAMGVWEKFTTIMENFAVSISPLLTALGWVADKILELQKALGNGFGIIVLITGAILFLIGTVVSFGVAAKIAGKLAGEGLGEGIKKIGDAAGKAGKSAMQGAVGMLAFGAAMLAIGAGIYFAAIGVAELVKSFGQLNGDQIGGALLAVTLGIGGLIAVIIILGGLAKAGVGALGVGMLIGIGIAVLAIGYGVKLAAEGLAKMLPGLGQFVKSLGELPVETLLILVVALGALAVIGGPLGLALVSIGLGFAAMSAGLWLMMKALDLDKLKALGDLAKSITDLMYGPGGEEAGAGGGEGGAPRSPFSEMVTAVSNLDEEKLDLAKELATVAMEYNIQANENFGNTGGGAFTAAAAGIGGTPAPGGGAAPAATNLPPIYLVLNNQIFGRLVADEIAKQKGLKLGRR